MGCGCSSERVRLEPVREQIIQTNDCSVQQPVLINRTSYVTETPSRTFWVAPSRENPAYVIGNVLTAPFRALTGRSLGEPDVLSSYNYAEPVGERITTVTSLKCGKHHMLKKVTLHRDSMLMPVGERYTTVKVIRTKPLLMPVGERFTTVRVIHKPLLQPVGERVTIIRRIQMKPVLEPVGERTILRTTRTYNNPWNSCDY